MVINIDRNGRPTDIEGHILSGKEAEAVYKLIGELNRKERNLERTDDSARQPCGMARA